MSDIGADEFNPCQLHVHGIASPGNTLVVGTEGSPGSDHILFLGTRPTNLLIQPYGQLLIHPFVVFEMGKTPGRSTLVIPPAPALEGVHVLLQGLITKQVATRIAGAFTNRIDLLIASRSNAIIETFENSLHLDAVNTTARWASGFKGIGLSASYGYGGDGSDGVLDLKGSMTLDSTTRTPGPDGVVAWNFRSVQIHWGATLVLKGSYPIRINLQESCQVDGTVLLSGRNGLHAPPGKALHVGRLAGGAGGPGGGAGGDANTNTTAPIGALPMELRGGPGWPRAGKCGEANRSANRRISVIEPNCGGGTGGNRGVPSGTMIRSGCSGNGGGHLSSGLQTDWICANIGAFGREFGVAWIIASGSQGVMVPTAGTGGGAGGNAAVVLGNPVPTDDIVAGSGGGGGGGLEIVAFETLSVSGTIHADGGNGGMGWSTVVSGSTISGGWGGGGAGGSIWLSGTSVVVSTTAQVTAMGGTGNPNPPNPIYSGHGGYGLVIIRDRGGDPVTTPSYIVPAPVAGRTLFDPATNGKSTAVSLFYDTGTSNPAWMFNASDPRTGEITTGSDLVFVKPPTPGQKVFIDFQGAPDLQGKPNPNPATWVPSNGYATDISSLRGKNLGVL